MMTVLILSDVLLMGVACALAVIVFALARQIGVLHERLAPIRAQSAMQGLTVGQVLPGLSMRTLDGDAFPVGQARDASARDGGVSQILLFVSADCPICKRVIPLAADVAGRRGMELVLVGDGAVPGLLAMRQTLSAQHPVLSRVPFVTGVELGLLLQIGRLPTLVVLDLSGTILARDLVNTRRQIETLAAAAPVAPALDHPDAKESAHVAV